MEQLEARKIALRYAKALLDAAQEENTLSELRVSLTSLRQIYQELPEFRRFFDNPAIPLSEKQDLVEKHLKKGVSPLVGNLLSLLVENERLDILSEVLDVSLELLNQREGIAKAQFIVPVPITATLEKKVRTTLEQLFGYQQVELETTVDSTILAGAIVKIGDKIIDGSYHSKLEMLRRQVG